MQVELMQKSGKYKNKEGIEKYFTNFFLKCGSNVIPIEVKYFPNAKCDDRDPSYSGRVEVLKAFADVIKD